MRDKPFARQADRGRQPHRRRRGGGERCARRPAAFELAEFSDETKRKMATIMPSWARPATRPTSGARFEQVGLDKTHQVFFEALLADRGVDGLWSCRSSSTISEDHDFDAFRAIIEQIR